MKDQYFGDINDYRKYGLLRAIICASGFRILVAWMLTPDDGSPDGKRIAYFKNPGKWLHYDPVLFRKITKLLRYQKRRVSSIENTGLFPKAEYFSSLVPDSSSDRSSWFRELAQRTQGSDFVFIDPDNGLEVKSKPYGKKDSSKFLYWREVEELWASGKSLLIYQQFIREKRPNFIKRMLGALKNATPGSVVGAFSTPHVVFFISLQPKHRKFYEAIVNLVQKDWEGQISVGI